MSIRFDIAEHHLNVITQAFFTDFGLLISLAKFFVKLVGKFLKFISKGFVVIEYFFSVHLLFLFLFVTLKPIFLSRFLLLRFN